MIFYEDVCHNCVRESDLEMNSRGKYDYPEGQFADSETASEDGAGSDTTVIYLTDSEDEAEAQSLYDGEADVHMQKRRHGDVSGKPCSYEVYIKRYGNMKVERAVRIVKH